MFLDRRRVHALRALRVKGRNSDHAGPGSVSGGRSGPSPSPRNRGRRRGNTRTEGSAVGQVRSVSGLRRQHHRVDPAHVAAEIHARPVSPALARAPALRGTPGSSFVRVKSCHDRSRAGMMSAVSSPRSLAYDEPGVLTAIAPELVGSVGRLPADAVDLCRAAQGLPPELASALGVPVDRLTEKSIRSVTDLLQAILRPSQSPPHTATPTGMTYEQQN